MPHTASLQESIVTRSLRKFVEGLSDPTLLIADNMQLLYANAEARMRFNRVNLSEETELKNFIKTIFPESDWNSISQSFATMRRNQNSDPILIYLAQGLKQTHMRISRMDFDEGGDCNPTNVIYCITFFDPDSNATMRRLEFVLDSSTDGIFIVNRTNHIIYFNKACERMTGWQKDAAIMQTYECANVLRCHNDEGESMGSESLCPAKIFFHKDSVPKPHEMLITTSSGKERYVETNYSPIKNPQGEVEFIVGIIRDIDERKKLESQLIQNRNLALLGQLVSGIAHEIKNPLGILMSGVEIVLNESRPEDQRREAASFLKDEIRRLDERMKYFLAFAKPKPLMIEKTDITQLLQKVATSYQTALRNPKFHVVPPICSHIPKITVDPDLLHQVFLNLILNAEQACGKQGVLTIVTDMVEDDTIRIRFIDSGSGINEKDLPKIFDPFFTTKSDGTGLGLSIVHQILTSHRGKINVRNNENKPGVTFEILLPIDETSETKN